MRIPKYVLALVAAALLAAACGDDDSSGNDERSVSDESSETTDEPTTAEVDDGVAAVIDGDEIPAATIDDAVDGLAQSPQFSEQLQGPEGEAARGQLQAQVLSSAITTKIVSSGAEDLGEPVTDDDIADARAELESQVGGPEALEAAIEEQGLTESLLDLELTSLAAMRNVQRALDAEAGEEAPEDSAPPSEDAELSPSEQRVQEFLVDALASAEVSVHEDYGVWNAESGQVVPPGGAPAPVPGGGGG